MAKKQYFENLFFVDCAIVYNSIAKGKAKNITESKKIFNIKSSVNARCDVVKGEDNIKNLDISKINLTSPNSKINGIKDNIVEVDQKIVDYVGELMEKETNNRKILEKLKQKLESEGVIMEKNVNVFKMNVVCDMGNNFVKCCANDGEVITFVNKATSVVDVNLISGDYIKNVDRQDYFVIGDDFGEFNITQNKFEKTNIVENVYYCISKCIDTLGIYGKYDSYSVSLGLLIPLNQMKDRNIYKSKIENESIWDCESRINDKEMKFEVSIDNIEILPEGAIAYPLILDDRGEIIVADIGSQTCNLSLISGGKFAKKHTIDHWGSFKYFRDLVKKVNNNEVTIHNIQRYIQNETPIDDDLTVIKHDEELLMDYNKGLLKEIKNAFGTKVNKIYYIGGTVELLKDNGIVPNEKSIVEYVENPSIANVEGARLQLNSMYQIQ